jgi:ATP-dependent helicase HrpA
MSYNIVDGKGKTIKLETNLRELQQELAKKTDQAVAKVASSQHAKLERKELTDWDFNELQLVIETEHSGKLVRAYPSLCLEGKKINLKVFAQQQDQASNHHRALAQLVAIQIQNPAKYITDHLKQTEKLALTTLGYGSVTEYVTDLTVALAAQKIESVAGDNLISNKTQFELVRDQVSAELVEKSFDIAKILDKSAANLRAATKAISNAKAIDFLNELAAEKQHLADLASKNLLSNMGLSRLNRLPIYFAAVEQRIIKLQENPARDRLSSSELNQALDAFEKAGGATPLQPGASSQVVSARWMLEELRVSLFAQSLGTSESVSVQRIKKLLS